MGDYGGVNGFDTSQSPQRSCLPRATPTQDQFLNLLGDGHLLLFLRFAFSFRCHVQVRFGFAHPRLPVRAASIFSPRLPSAPHLIILLPIFPSRLPCFRPHSDYEETASDIDGDNDPSYDGYNKLGYSYETGLNYEGYDEDGYDEDGYDEGKRWMNLSPPPRSS